MKVKYIGETFYDGLGLTNGKIYECISIDKETKCLEIIDDDNEETLYPIDNPRPADGSSKGGKWEIIEDKDNKLSKYLQKVN